MAANTVARLWRFTRRRAAGADKKRWAPPRAREQIISNRRPTGRVGIEQAIITWVHLVSAAIWVGGGLFLGVVLAPVLRRTSMPLHERIGLMVRVGRRFNRIAVPSLIVLIGTGLYSAHGILGRPDLLLGSSYGTFLVAKMALVAAVIAAFVVHVRVVGGGVDERIASGEMTDGEVRRLRRRIIILGEVVTVLSVAILFMAALLDSGFSPTRL